MCMYRLREANNIAAEEIEVHVIIKLITTEMTASHANVAYLYRLRLTIAQNTLGVCCCRKSIEVAIAGVSLRCI